MKCARVQSWSFAWGRRSEGSSWKSDDPRMFSVTRLINAQDATKSAASGSSSVSGILRRVTANSGIPQTNHRAVAVSRSPAASGRAPLPVVGLCGMERCGSELEGERRCQRRADAAIAFDLGALADLNAV